MSSNALIASGELLDDTLRLNLSDLRQRSAVQVEVIIEMVQIGVLEPQGQSPTEWLFNGHDLARLQRALRLQRDLGINLPGLALCIELLEERDKLHARVRVLEQRG